MGFEIYSSEFLYEEIDEDDQKFYQATDITKKFQQTVGFSVCYFYNVRDLELVADELIFVWISRPRAWLEVMVDQNISGVFVIRKTEVYQLRFILKLTSLQISSNPGRAICSKLLALYVALINE